MKQEIFSQFYDAAKWGVSDFYEKTETVLKDAINNLINNGTDFDTGWYSVKKEIQSGRIKTDNGVAEVSASCSDDFDTEGTGTVLVDLNQDATTNGMITKSNFERIVEALDMAMGMAEENRKDNQVYAGFSIGKDVDGKLLNWIYTIILPQGYGTEMEEPPGDNYHQWGWQEEPDDIPEKCRNVLMQFANNWLYNEDNTRGRLIKHGVVCGGWRIKPWEDD